LHEVQEVEKTEEASYGTNRIRRSRAGILGAAGCHLCLEERLAAIAKGVQVPIAEELPPHARSRHAAILLIAGGLGYTVAFMLLSRFDTEAIQAAVFGVIPISIGIGYSIDAVLVRRELRP
jgi:disulfide bond formation protein DsbB